MRPMTTLRKWQIEQLNRHVPILKFMIRNEETKRLISRREKTDGWTAAEVIGHLLDCEKLFIQRVKMTMTQNEPLLPFPPQNDDVTNGRYNEKDPNNIIEEWNKVREEYIQIMKEIPEESWERKGRHPVYEPFSIDDQLALACRHTIQHFEQITRILKA